MLHSGTTYDTLTIDMDCIIHLNFVY